MNDDIISLPNGDFYVAYKTPEKSLKEILIERFSFEEPISQKEADEIWHKQTEFKKKIEAGQKLMYCIIRNPKIHNQEFVGKLCIISEDEIDYYSENCILSSKNDDGERMLILERIK